MQKIIRIALFTIFFFGIKILNAQEFYCTVDVGYNYSYNCAFAKDGKYLVYADFNQIHFFDISTKKDVKVIKIGKADINGFCLSKKEKWLILGNDSNFIMIYDFKTMQLKHKFYKGKDEDGNFNCLTISNDEKRLMYKDEHSVKIMDLKTFKKTDSIPVQNAITLDFHPIENKIVIGDYYNILMYDCTKRKIIDTLYHTLEYKEANQVKFNTLGNKLISIGFQGGDGIAVWDFKLKKIIMQIDLAGHAGDYNGFAINPNETIVGSLNSTNDYSQPESNEDGSENLTSPYQIQFHSLNTGKEIKKIQLFYKTHLNHSEEFNYFLFSNDGKYFAASGMNGITLWKM